MFPSFIPPFLPYTHVFIVFFCCFSATPLPDAHKMGLSGKTFAPHISHKGSLWPITVLMEARDSHQLHAFFPSHAWTPAKAQLALSRWCCLWQWYYRCPEKWPIVARSSPYYKALASKGLELHGGGHYISHFFPKCSKNGNCWHCLDFKRSNYMLTCPRIGGQPLVSLFKGPTVRHASSSCA